MDNKLKQLIESLLKDNSLLHAVLSSPRNKTSAQKVVVRPVSIKNKTIYQFSQHYPQKVIHKNWAPHQCKDLFIELFSDYKQALFCTSADDYHILLNKKAATILRKAPTKKPLQMVSHNRPKNYILQEGTPIPFLIELGVMSPSGKIVSEKRDKFRQINRFLEMIGDVLPYLSKNKTLRIVDFGCGKAYLTFALYHFLHVENNYDIEIAGLDLKADVVAFCQEIADKLQYKKLRFLQGDIQAYSTNDPIDMMVCLHACDTATDAALEKAVHWKAKVILAVPCCQHELFKQVECENLDPLLKHGILKERFAALATDAARCQFLEIVGYKTQILEFIDMEHTPKNLLIRAVYQPGKENKAQLIKNYLDFKKLLNISPQIEKLFSKELYRT